MEKSQKLDDTLYEVAYRLYENSLKLFIMQCTYEYFYKVCIGKYNDDDLDVKKYINLAKIELRTSKIKQLNERRNN